MQGRAPEKPERPGNGHAGDRFALTQCLGCARFRGQGVSVGQCRPHKFWGPRDLRGGREGTWIAISHHRRQTSFPASSPFSVAPRNAALPLNDRIAADSPRKR